MFKQNTSTTNPKKGRKFYGVMRSNDTGEPICITMSKDAAISSVDIRFNVLVECTITRVFIKNPTVIEIENE